MFRTIQMGEVPPRVWREVSEKWAHAYITGWSPDLWHGCTLCTWIDHHGYGCSSCPISQDKWCNNVVDGSRLHRTHYPEVGDADDDTGEWQWREAVFDFLEFIAPYYKGSENVKMKYIEL